MYSPPGGKYSQKAGSAPSGGDANYGSSYGKWEEGLLSSKPMCGTTLTQKYSHGTMHMNRGYMVAIIVPVQLLISLTQRIIYGDYTLYKCFVKN